MSEVMMEPTEVNLIALTKARLETVLQEARKDEAKLRKSLELKRLKRRIRGAKSN